MVGVVVVVEAAGEVEDEGAAEASAVAVVDRAVVFLAGHGLPWEVLLLTVVQQPLDLRRPALGRRLPPGGQQVLADLQLQTLEPVLDQTSEVVTLAQGVDLLFSPAHDRILAQEIVGPQTFRAQV